MVTSVICEAFRKELAGRTQVCSTGLLTMAFDSEYQTPTRYNAIFLGYDIPCARFSFIWGGAYYDHLAVSALLLSGQVYELLTDMDQFYEPQDW